MLAAIFIVDVLASKSLAALDQTGMDSLVVAGGVGANRHLRATLDAAAETRKRGARVYYPELELCTDNGAMIALVGALRLQGGADGSGDKSGVTASRGFTVKPRWDLASL